MSLKYQVTRIHVRLRYKVIRTTLRLKYFRHGRYHRLDGPAVLWVNGDLYWYQYGEPQ